VLFTENHPQRLGRDRPPPKTEKNGGPWTDGLIQNRNRLPLWIEPDRLIRRIIDHKPNRFAKRGDGVRKAIEHLPHESYRPVGSVKIDPEEFLDADYRSHENRARHGSLCENDGMRMKILPPDFVTGFGFLSLDQFDFSNRLVKRTLHGFRGCFQGLW
jgi:hypothetical protein